MEAKLRSLLAHPVSEKGGGGDELQDSTAAPPLTQQTAYCKSHPKLQSNALPINPPSHPKKSKNAPNLGSLPRQVQELRGVGVEFVP